MIAVVWAAWLLALLVMAVFGQTPALHWLLLLLPFCLLASCVVTWLASKKLLLSMKIKDGGGKKQGAKGELTAINKGFLPVFQLRCRLQLQNLLTGEIVEQLLSVPVLPNQKRQMSFAIKSRHCGHLVVSFKKVMAVDFFGLTRFKVPFNAEAGTLIAPNTFSMRVLPSVDSVCPEESDEYEPDRAGNDVSEVHQIRGYVPGDSVRQIHWKLTGKYDQLMVKQAGQPLTFAMLLFVDFGVARHTSPECIDTLAEVAVSLSQALLDAGIAHILAWPQSDGQLGQRAIQNADNLFGALPDMLSGHDVDLSTAEGAGAVLFENIRFSQMIWLCTSVPKCDFDSKMTVLCCVNQLPEKDDIESQAALFFTPKTYKRDIASLIL